MAKPTTSRSSTFQASSIEITALATGDVDFALLGYSSFGIAVDAAKMEDLRLVFDNFRDGVDGYYSFKLAVLKDSPIQTIDDLKGKIIATNGGGSVVDIAQRYVLKHAAEDKRDYTTVEVLAPRTCVPMLAAARSISCRSIPTTCTTPRSATMCGHCSRKRTRVPAPDRVLRVLLRARTGVSSPTATARRSPISSRMSWLRVAVDARDPANRAEAVQIAVVAKITKQSADILGHAYYLLPGEDDYRDPDSRPDPAALQRNVDAMLELGFIKSKIDVPRYTDLSFIDATAVQRVNQGEASR